MSTEDTQEDGLNADTFQEDLEIDGHNLNNAFMRQASLFAYYAATHVGAMRKEARAKLLLEIEEAKVAKSIRDKMVAEGTKTTEKQIEQEVSRTPSYIKAVNAYNEAKANTALAASAVEAFRQRRDMLIQLGANQREELKGETRVVGHDRVRQELRERMS
jgi:hypothetical protein